MKISVTNQNKSAGKKMLNILAKKKLKKMNYLRVLNCVSSETKMMFEFEAQHSDFNEKKREFTQRFKFCEF